MNKILLLGVCSLLAVGCQAPDSADATAQPEAADRQAVTAEINAEADRMLDAWSSLESQPYLDLYTEDVTWLYEGASIDRPTFEGMVRDYMAGHTRAEWEWTERDVQVLGPEAAVFSGVWTLVQTDTAGVEVEDAGAITLVYELRNGEWKVVHAHESLSGDEL
ncbi:MAG: SgcJ/EcaC family oxidoreductase [Longimicrobiales bacterium]